MTFRAAFLNLFMFRKWRILSTKPPVRGTSAAWAACVLIQTWFKDCSAVYRWEGFIFNNMRIKFLASSETFFQSATLKEKLPNLTFASTSASISAKNGGEPQSSTYMMTPAAHVSHNWLYLPARTCGAT